MLCSQASFSKAMFPGGRGSIRLCLKDILRKLYLVVSNTWLCLVPSGFRISASAFRNASWVILGHPVHNSYLGTTSLDFNVFPTGNYSITSISFNLEEKLRLRLEQLFRLCWTYQFKILRKIFTVISVS
jgi:hypothetical protein